MSDVARQNKEMTLKAIEELFRKRSTDISSKICKNYLKHVKHVEKSDWKTDRIIGAKLDRLQIIALEAEDNKDDSDSEYSDSTEEEKVEGCFEIYFSFLF